MERGKASTAEDGYHKLTVHGDAWTFYDLDMSTRARGGTFSCPYYVANMPRTFMRAVERLARKTWRLLRKGKADCEASGGDKYDLPHRIVLDVPLAHRKRVERLYGQGLGDVRIDFGDHRAEETEAAWQAAALASAATTRGGGERGRFLDMGERLVCIARNSTRGFHQTATLRVSRDGGSFYWTALAPNGQRIMSGGLIFHKACSEWSIHT